MKKQLLLAMLFIMASIVSCNERLTPVTPSTNEEEVLLISNASKDLSPEFLKATEAVVGGIKAYTSQLTTEKIKAFEGNPELEGQRLGEFVNQYARTNYSMDFNSVNASGARMDATAADDKLGAEGQGLMDMLNSIIDYRLKRIDAGIEPEGELDYINKGLTIVYNSCVSNKKISEHDRQIVLSSCYSNQQLLLPVGNYFDTVTNGGVKAPSGRVTGWWKRVRHIVTAVVRVVVNTTIDIVKNGLVGCAKGTIASGPSGCVPTAVANITSKLSQSVATGVKAGACAWKKNWSNAELIKGTTCQ